MLDLESLFNLSYGMCIVSSCKDGKLNGCLVNTVFQITPEPPMIAISVSRENLTNDYIAQSKVFAVSILAEGASLQFMGKFGFRSGRDIEKFQDINYKTDVTGSPILMDSTVGFIEAQVIEKIDIETHTIFIGKVLSCETIDDGKIPMTYTYYRDVKGGKTPRTAATYIAKKTKVKVEQGATYMKKYRCLVCGYIYDPAVGAPAEGVEAGTAFEDLPDDWICPECGVGKDQFEVVAE